MGRDKTLFAGLLLVAFLAITYLAFQFIQESVQESVKEPFTTIKEAITRASDCRCVPGYIPSNRAEDKVTPSTGPRTVYNNTAIKVKEENESSNYFCKELGGPGIKKCY
jgi:hypothetical protein